MVKVMSSIYLRIAIYGLRGLYFIFVPRTVTFLTSGLKYIVRVFS